MMNSPTQRWLCSGLASVQFSLLWPHGHKMTATALNISTSNGRKEHFLLFFFLNQGGNPFPDSFFWKSHPSVLLPTLTLNLTHNHDNCLSPINSPWIWRWTFLPKVHCCLWPDCWTKPIFSCERKGTNSRRADSKLCPPYQHTYLYFNNKLNWKYM